MPNPNFMQDADFESNLGLSPTEVDFAIRMDKEQLPDADPVIKQFIEDKDEVALMHLISDEEKLLARLDEHGHHLVVHEIAKLLNPDSRELDMFLQHRPLTLMLQDKNLNSALHYLASNKVDLLGRIEFRHMLLRNRHGATPLHLMAVHPEYRERILALPASVLSLSTKNGVSVQDAANSAEADKLARDFNEAEDEMNQTEARTSLEQDVFMTPDLTVHPDVLDLDFTKLHLAHIEHVFSNIGSLLYSNHKRPEDRDQVRYDVTIYPHREERYVSIWVSENKLEIGNKTFVEGHLKTPKYVMDWLKTKIQQKVEARVALEYDHEEFSHDLKHYPKRINIGDVTFQLKHAESDRLFYIANNKMSIEVQPLNYKEIIVLFELGQNTKFRWYIEAERLLSLLETSDSLKNGVNNRLHGQHHIDARASLEYCKDKSKFNRTLSTYPQSLFSNMLFFRFDKKFNDGDNVTSDTVTYTARGFKFKIQVLFEDEVHLWLYRDNGETELVHDHAPIDQYSDFFVRKWLDKNVRYYMNIAEGRTALEANTISLDSPSEYIVLSANGEQYRFRHIEMSQKFRIVEYYCQFELPTTTNRVQASITVRTKLASNNTEARKLITCRLLDRHSAEHAEISEIAEDDRVIEISQLNRMFQTAFTELETSAKEIAALARSVKTEVIDKINDLEFSNFAFANPRSGFVIRCRYYDDLHIFGFRFREHKLIVEVRRPGQRPSEYHELVEILASSSHDTIIGKIKSAIQKYVKTL